MSLGLALSTAGLVSFVFYLVIHGDVDVEDVALHQRPAVGHPVCCHVIHRARDAFRETLESK